MVFLKLTENFEKFEKFQEFIFEENGIYNLERQFHDVLSGFILDAGDNIRKILKFSENQKYEILQDFTTSLKYCKIQF